jgi:biotin carboxylase
MPTPRTSQNGTQNLTILQSETRLAEQEQVQKADASPEIHNGVVKEDIVVSDGNPYVIELAARLSGGYFCTHEIPLNTGVDLVGAAIRQSLGEPIHPDDLQNKFLRPVAQGYWFPRPGIVQQIEGAEQFRDYPDVAYLELRVSPGDQVGPIDSHPARAGVVITTRDTDAAALALVEEVVKTIKITTTRD